MSTFKRLLNVGKGKARTARRDVAQALDPGEMLDGARHKAADLAEAVAEALRPAPTDADPAVAPADPPEPAEPELDRPRGQAAHDPSPPDDPGTPLPRKRRL